MTLSWNGNDWFDTRNPYVGASASLDGVSCVTDTSCVAVGSAFDGQRGQALIETWNGTQWSAVRGPRTHTDDTLNAVSCISTTRCFAVGVSYRASTMATNVAATLAETWDGRRWSIAQGNALPSSWNVNLAGVSCVSATSCTAVGSAQPPNAVIERQSLIETWNGNRWTVIAHTLDGGARVVASSLTAVSCVSPTRCVAVGSSLTEGLGILTLVKAWDGARWSSVPSPESPDHDVSDNQLSGVSCLSPTSCVAAGTGSRESTIGHPGAARTLIESWDGSRWSVTPSPNPGSFDDSTLAGVSCTSEHCAAVGSGALIPPLALSGVISRRTVTVSWTPAESARLRQIAAYLHLSPAATQKAAVYGTAYLIGLGPSTPTPVTLPAMGTSASYTTVWAPSELAIIDSVRVKFALAGSVAATRLSVYLLSYLLALGGH